MLVMRETEINGFTKHPYQLKLGCMTPMEYHTAFAA